MVWNVNCGAHYNHSNVYVKCYVVISCNHRLIYESLLLLPSLSEYINFFTPEFKGEGEEGTCNDIAKHSACMILQALTL